MNKILSLLLAVAISSYPVFLFVEPEITDSASATDSVGVSLQVTEEIAISSPPDVTLPSIGGMGAASSTGSFSWTVTTNNSAGYTLAVKASTSPALQSGSDSIADYTPATPGTPDFNFSVGANDAEFGYSVEGSDTAQLFLDNGSACNTGTTNAVDKCWLNFTTTDITVARSTSETPPSGTPTTLKLRVDLGTNAFVPSGIYSATIIGTATTL